MFESVKNVIIENGYYPLKGLKKIIHFFGRYSNDELRVLIYHDIAPYDYNNFAKQIQWLSNSWNFITPEQFEAIVSGHERLSGKQLLITFDDGFMSNREVTELFLNPLGIKAIFFCVSEFIDIQDDEEAKKFILNNICLGFSVNKTPDHWKNMSWGDLAALLEQGHTIGAHTKTHSKLSQISDMKQLKTEIVDSADIIASRLGTTIDHFAYTFGDIGSISKEAIQLAKSRFKFIYSGIRGDNRQNISQGIYRDAAATQDKKLNYYIYSNRLLGSFLEGAADPVYREKRKQLQIWYKS